MENLEKTEIIEKLERLYNEEAFTDSQGKELDKQIRVLKKELMIKFGYKDIPR